jgi:hypothetical protein
MPVSMVVLAGRPPEWTQDEFTRWWRGPHADAAKVLPGLVAYRHGFVTTDYDSPGVPGWDGHAVLTFADQAALERTGSYRGLYFVLMGRLSPLDGIGPRDVGADQLLARASDGVTEEVIVATNFTAEGEATAHVLAQALKSRGVRVTRLARGVPIGSELEYVDLGTIAHAFVDRR